MKDIIKITEKDGNQVVSAKELYLFLQLDKSNYTRWSKKNIVENVFARENEDWEGFVIMTNGNETMDYALTIDFAKRLAMMARTEKGEQARRYFIECEKEINKNSKTQIDFSNPDTILLLVNNWKEEQEKRIQAEKTIQEKQKIIDKQAPKIQFLEKVLDADEKIDIGQASKILGLPFGRNTMFKQLREKGVFFKNKNEPKQEYIAKKYFELKEKWIDRNEHDSFLIIKVLVTQRGLEFLSKLFEAITKQTQLVRLN